MNIHHTDVVVEPANTDLLLQYFAYADEVRKTWFISKSGKETLKDCFLLLELGCKPTNDPPSFDDIMPKVGDVIFDMEGDRIRVVSVDWV